MRELYETYSSAIDRKIAEGIERTSEIIKAILIDTSEKLGISHTQAQIITSINETGVSQKILCDKLALDPSTLTKSTKSLERKGFILIEKKGKSKILHITEDGRKIKKIIENKISKAVNYILPHLSSSEKISVYKFIYKFIECSLDRKIINYQRMCSSCRFLRHEHNLPYCLFLKKKLKLQDLMINCPDYTPHH